MPSSNTVTALDNTGGPAVQAVWAAVLTAASWSRDSAPAQAPCTFAADPADGLRPVAETSPDRLLQRDPALGWVVCAGAPAAAKGFFDLYLPLCNASARNPLTVAHLGQSLDGFIATRSGDSDYVTGPENLTHLHRMRALCDAVVVGAETVARDDPQLTVRRASGENPLRIVLDPQRRLDSAHGVFTDAAAATLLVCDEALVERADEKVGAAEVLGLPMRTGGLDLRSLLTTLRARQLWSVFIEGGGRTISTFLEQGLLDRLQIAVAPLIIGAGRPGIHLPVRERLTDCPRLSPRVYTTGDDILFDCDLRDTDANATP